MQTTGSDDVTVDGRRVVLVRPDGEGPWPGVVMIHEAWGIDDVLRRQAARLAGAGYLVMAPDLLGEGSRLRCMAAAMRALQSRQGRPFEVVEACRAWLVEQPDCTGKVGVIGFCMGGGFAVVLASRGFDVSSVNYGMVPDDIDEVLRGACPVVGSYGEKDRQFGPYAAKLEDALSRAGIPHDVATYPSAGHSFLNDAPNGPAFFRPLARIMHAGPDPVAAADAWRRIEAFFAHHLGAQ
ncbi:dienelactone hydrolase family protein [Microlunatus ginsengisoli]|uniref:Dienelactone hydrolase family protein n=1 Tax=Microlunatus ginsengisoli TaxID=363863 RepID=A0ABP7AGB3_9ACTN